MSTDLIESFLEKIKSDKTFDKEMADLLMESYQNDEEAEITTQKIHTLISARYAKNKKLKN